MAKSSRLSTVTSRTLSAPFSAGEAKRKAPCSRPCALPSSTSAERRARNWHLLAKQSVRRAVDSGTLQEPLFEGDQIIQQVSPLTNILLRGPWPAIGVTLP